MRKNNYGWDMLENLSHRQQHQDLKYKFAVDENLPCKSEKYVEKIQMMRGIRDPLTKSDMIKLEPKPESKPTPPTSTPKLNYNYKLQSKNSPNSTHAYGRVADAAS
jgi:hypothetical protein